MLSLVDKRSALAERFDTLLMLVVLAPARAAGGSLDLVGSRQALSSSLHPSPLLPILLLGPKPRDLC
jgi:hypothetical protein